MPENFMKIAICYSYIHLPSLNIHNHTIMITHDLSVGLHKNKCLNAQILAVTQTPTQTENKVY